MHPTFQKFPVALFLLCFSLLCSLGSSVLQPQLFKSTCLTYVGKVNEKYSSTINNDATMLYVFTMDFSNLRDPQNTNVRVEATVGHTGTLDYPVIFAIGQQSRLTAIELPYSPFQNESVLYYDAARTLCVPSTYREDIRNITVRVSTRSRTNVNFEMKVSVTQDYLIPINQETQFEVGPTAPMTRGFLFNRNMADLSSVRILATSRDLTCMTVSIQPLTCPIFDQQNNVQFNGLWQTMTQLSAVTIEKNSKFDQGFVLVFVVHNTDEQCHKSFQTQTISASSYKSSLRRKTVKLLIGTDERHSSGLFFVYLMIPVLCSVIVVLLTWILFRLRHNWLQTQGARKEADIPNTFTPQKNYRYTLSTNGESDDVLRQRTLNSTNEENTHNLVNPPNLGEGTEVDGNNTNSSSIRFLADIYVGDFTRILPGRHMFDKNSRQFCWSLLTVAIFYTIPVYQLLFQYLRGLYATGQLDTCYYNYLCSHGLGYLLDFNHFFSNIGYVIFGISFILIVRRRDRNLKYRRSEIHLIDSTKRSTSIIHLEAGDEDEDRIKCCCCFQKVETKVGHGIAPHFGVFYALGLALIIEGLLSGAYHICPSASNFQFDTCFMYVISALVLIKVYQFRHPVSLAAHQTFLILAGLILVAVGGLLLEFGGSDSNFLRGFRIAFITVQFLSILMVSIYHYTMGYFKEPDNRIATDWSLISRLKFMGKKPVRVDRLILPIITISMCSAVVTYSEISQLDFGTYLLYTFVSLVLGFCTYYILIMKPLHGEFKNGLWMQPTFYFLASGLVGGWAVFYFIKNPAQWEKSAAESRSENNLPCMQYFPFMEVYGVHDAWHYLSGAALFFAFMGLLCVDDDLFAIPETKIPVF